MGKKVIFTKNAPAAIGPYAQGIDGGSTVYVSGQLPADPETGEFAGKDIASQTEQSLKNVQAVLGEAGLTLGNVVKASVFLKDMGDFAAMNVRPNCCRGIFSENHFFSHSILSFSINYSDNNFIN